MNIDLCLRHTETTVAKQLFGWNITIFTISSSQVTMAIHVVLPHEL